MNGMAGGAGGAQWGFTPSYARERLNFEKEIRRRPKWWEPLLWSVGEAVAQAGGAGLTKVFQNALMTDEEMAQQQAQTGLLTARAGASEAEAGYTREKPALEREQLAALQAVEQMKGEYGLKTQRTASLPSLIEALERGDLTREELSSKERIAQSSLRGRGGGGGRAGADRLKVFDTLMREGRLQDAYTLMRTGELPENVGPGVPKRTEPEDTLGNLFKIMGKRGGGAPPEDRPLFKGPNDVALYVSRQEQRLKTPGIGDEERAAIQAEIAWANKQLAAMKGGAPGGGAAAPSDEWVE